MEHLICGQPRNSCFLQTDSFIGQWDGTVLSLLKSNRMLIYRMYKHHKVSSQNLSRTDFYFLPLRLFLLKLYLRNIHYEDILQNNNLGICLTCLATGRNDKKKSLSQSNRFYFRKVPFSDYLSFKTSTQRHLLGYRRIPFQLSLSLTVDLADFSQSPNIY